MKLKQDEIIKALHCCKWDDVSMCKQCQYYKPSNSNSTCVSEMCTDALALIYELTKENERLKNRITCQVVLPDEKLEEIKNDCLSRVELDIKAIEADTVRKMFERITEHATNGYPRKVRLDVIDQIAKEMLEGDNNGCVS